MQFKQSNNQTIKQSNNQTIKQSNNQTIKQSNNQTIKTERQKDRKTENKKFLNLEVLRIIGCISIVFIHLFSHQLLDAVDKVEIYAKLARLNSSGRMAVEMFFIISGLLFSIKLDLNQSILDFVKKKLIRLYPVLVFVVFASAIICALGLIEFSIFDDLLALFLLNGTGLVLRIVNTTGPFRYVSAMLWTMLLFMYLLKNFEKKYVDLMIVLLIFFSYTFIIHALNGRMYGPVFTYYNFINIGMLRAFGGIGLGYLIGEWYKIYSEKIEHAMVSTKTKILITLSEFACLFFIVYNLLLHDIKFDNRIIFVIVFAITIMLFISKKGFISKFLDNKVFSKISKYTYSIYMTHLLTIMALSGSLWKNCQTFVYEHPVSNIATTLLLVTTFGIFTYHVIEVPSAKFLRKKFLKKV